MLMVWKWVERKQTLRYLSQIPGGMGLPFFFSVGRIVHEWDLWFGKANFDVG